MGARALIAVLAGLALACAAVIIACGQSGNDGGTTGGTNGAGATSTGGIKGGGGSGGGGGGVGGLGSGGCVSNTSGLVPCAEAGLACANNPGCHATQLCVANGCAVFVDGSCENQPGCTWDNDAGTCVPPSCDTFDAGSCPTDAGCYVLPGCEGKPAPCDELVKCEYPGCSYLL